VAFRRGSLRHFNHIRLLGAKRLFDHFTTIGVVFRSLATFTFQLSPSG
jgi:hypothetical protein